MTVDIPTDHVDWPAELRSYAKGDRLQFTTRGPHPFVWIAVPFAVMLCAVGVLGFAGFGASGFSSFIAEIAAIAFASAVLASAAYTSWGAVELERRGGVWIVTRRLGSLRSVSTFGSARIRSAAVCSPPPYVVVWPGSAGRHLRVNLSDRESPVEIGAGLLLDAATLRALQALFTPHP